MVLPIRRIPTPALTTSVHNQVIPWRKNLTCPPSGHRQDQDFSHRGKKAQAKTFQGLSDVCLISENPLRKVKQTWDDSRRQKASLTFRLPCVILTINCRVFSPITSYVLKQYALLAG